MSGLEMRRSDPMKGTREPFPGSVVEVRKESVMKPSRMRSMVRAALVSATAVPLLASWLVVSGCGDGRSGFTMVLHALGYSVTASYCHT
jgi:hypothetical protein